MLKKLVKILLKLEDKWKEFAKWFNSKYKIDKLKLVYCQLHQPYLSNN